MSTSKHDNTTVPTTALQWQWLIRVIRCMDVSPKQHGYNIGLGREYVLYRLAVNVILYLNYRHQKKKLLYHVEIVTQQIINSKQEALGEWAMPWLPRNDSRQHPNPRRQKMPSHSRLVDSGTEDSRHAPTHRLQQGEYCHA